MDSPSGCGVRSLGPGDAAVPGPQPAGRPPLRPYHRHGSPGSVTVESVDDAEGLSVAVERCPLCGSARRKLTCSRCVQSGDFVYIDGRNPER